MLKKFLLPLFFSVLTTVIFLLALETGARVLEHFKPNLNEYEHVVENQGFRTDNKQPGEIRIFVLGESAVEGIPYSREMSFTGFLNQLAGKADLKNVKFVNLGVKGRHSFYQREIAPLFPKYKADAVIIYAGNNDTRDFSNVIRDVPGAWLDFILTWRSAFYAGLKRKILAAQEAVNKRSGTQVFSINHNSDDAWHWTDAYIRKKKEYMETPEKGLERKRRAIQDYENNLSALVKDLKSKNIRVFVCSLGINHKTLPSISDVKLGLGPHGKGYEIYYGGDKNNAELAPLNPINVYREGEELERLRQFEQAREKYLQARELEIQSPGGSVSKNKSLERIAKKHNTEWIDIQETLESVSPSKIVGSDVFLDHCHYNLYGHKTVASRIMQSLCRNFLQCPASFSDWQEIFSRLSEGKLDDKNLSNEHLMTAFYLINGTQWERQPQYEKALIYLEKAYSLNPENPKIYPLLAETYSKLGRTQEAEEFSAKMQGARA